MFKCLARKTSAKWILEGDIKGCFDNISHKWLIKNIPMDKRILKQFLKAGFVFKQKLYGSYSGTPQGGIISPLLANIALDGMEAAIGMEKKGKGFPGPVLVKYADDNKGLIVNRHRFHLQLLSEFENYVAQIRNPYNIEIRNKFIKKMRAICRTACEVI